MRQQTPAAWVGDHQRRLSECLLAKGFKTATEYADAHPTASILALADDVGGSQPIAAVQVERRLFDEAVSRNTIERHLRDLLSRRLHEHIPEGWRHDWGQHVPGDVRTPWARRAHAFAHWATVSWLAPFQRAIDQVIDSIVNGPSTVFPLGWLPVNADDPYLVEFFAKHWRT